MPAHPQDEWLPPLQECVTRINDTFSASFATIGCAGEVALHEADDYDQFAIHIRRGRSVPFPMRDVLAECKPAYSLQ